MTILNAMDNSKNDLSSWCAAYRRKRQPGYLSIAVPSSRPLLLCAAFAVFTYASDGMQLAQAQSVTYLSLIHI